ncbi:MAG: arginine deiminase family protein [Chloroflexota bacterium]
MHLLPSITKILARRPATNFADGLTTQALGEPDVTLAMQQYENYLTALRHLGLDVTVLDADENYPDGHFVEDPLIIFHDLAFVCKSGATARQGEATGLLPHLSEHHIIEIEGENAFMDGGDVLICADRVLVGISERTTVAGANALKKALQTVKANIRVDYVEFDGVLHLKSGLTELAPNVLIHDPTLNTDYDMSWAKFITLPTEEGYAADVMPVNDTLFLADGYPTAYEIAQRYYNNIITLDMSEFQKMDGGLTCLSLRY